MPAGVNQGSYPIPSEENLCLYSLPVFPVSYGAGRKNGDFREQEWGMLLFPIHIELASNHAVIEFTALIRRTPKERLKILFRGDEIGFEGGAGEERSEERRVGKECM